MTPDLITGVAITCLVYGLLIVTGVNQMRHAHLLKLGFDGYMMATVWLWLAANGLFGLILSLGRIAEYGMPVSVLHTSGYIRPLDGIVTRQWVMIAIALLVSAVLAFRSWVMLRNVRKFDIKTREEALAMHNKMIRLTQITEKMEFERQHTARVTTKTWAEFEQTIRDIQCVVQRDEYAT